MQRLARSLALLAGLAGCGGAPQPQGPAASAGTKETAMTATATATRNKQLVRTALQELFGNRDTGAFARYWGEPYLQHNPRVPDGIKPLEPMVGMTQRFETHRVLAEGDLVVTHSLARGWGPAPMVVFDVFLVRNDRIVEHWDIMQPLADQTVSGRTQLDGPTELGDPARTAASKATVNALLDRVMYGHQMDELPRLIDPTRYHQHNPGVGDGLEGFGAAMAALAKQGLKMEYHRTHRVVADGDFVFTHSEGEFAGRRVAFADLFRVENGKIVEHWDCIQDVVPADETASKHDMFAQVTP